MCGIVGLFLKDKSLEPRLGELLSAMLITMTDRGPDSAGIAIYGAAAEGLAKITVQSPQPDADFVALEALLNELTGGAATVTRSAAVRRRSAACPITRTGALRVEVPATSMVRWPQRDSSAGMAGRTVAQRGSVAGSCARAGVAHSSAARHKVKRIAPAYPQRARTATRRSATNRAMAGFRYGAVAGGSG